METPKITLLEETLFEFGWHACAFRQKNQDWMDDFGLSCSDLMVECHAQAHKFNNLFTSEDFQSEKLDYWTTIEDHFTMFINIWKHKYS